MAEITVLSTVLALSIFLNIYLFKRLRTKLKTPTMDQDAAALLSDILGGQGLVSVQRIAPENMFLRSPGS